MKTPMKYKDAFGCSAAFGIIAVGLIIGAATPLGVFSGFLISGLLVLILSSVSRSRSCEICSAPIRHTSYSATIWDKTYSVICAKCKDEITDKLRKESLGNL